jgi:hypothetical protein
MTDETLLATFEAGTIAPAALRHREHVRVAWLLLGRYARVEAERRLMQGLRDVAVRAGKPAHFDVALTRAWMNAIEIATAQTPRQSTFDALVAAHPDLLDPASVCTGAGQKGQGRRAKGKPTPENVNDALARRP